MPDDSFKLYIIGPVTGYPNDNIGLFENARQAILEINNRKTGTPYTVEIPHDTIPAKTSWTDALRKSIHNITNQDIKGVVLLDGWDTSRDAMIELQIALLLNIPVKPLNWWTNTK